MWKMFDELIECDECGGPLGPPPKFLIPPPPRPPALGEYSLANCNEEEMALKAKQAWDNDMCEAMPILDASLYSSQSLQTSAMIAVFSLLLVLVVLISSLFVWKNKRKVQNFLPCKTPTRGPHLNGGLPLGGGHAVTYEDPDAHLGHHRPLVMRHHHNVEIMHGKGIHYPSGYPMTRSPPFLVSSSPGPDPYRSNDNVYEELGPGRDSDGESEPPLHSDDDFAEDELSLPGERSFNKEPAVSTIYHERSAASGSSVPPPVAVGVGGASGGANLPERTSVLSSSSSNQDASTATVASSASSHNNNTASANIGHSNNSNNNNNNGSSGSSGSGSGNNNGGSATGGPARSGPGGLLGGMLRHTTGRSKFHTAGGGAGRGKGDRKHGAADELNTSSSTADTGDLRPLQQLYDNRSNLMSLAYLPHQHAHPHAQPHPHAHAHAHHHQPQHHSLHHHNNNSSAGGRAFYNTLESEVERRNRINAQLSHAPAVATIFRERINYPAGGGGRGYPQPYYASNGGSGSGSGSGFLASSMRARTNPRSMERRHRVAAPAEPIEPAYGYAEPLYPEHYHYDRCVTPTLQQRLAQPLVYPAYVSPEYSGNGSGSSGGYRSAPPGAGAATYQNQAALGTQLYARGDSSFGSDSGYSHHTPASSIGRHDYDVALPMPKTAVPAAAPTTTPTPTPSKLSSALSFGWGRRKSATQPPPATLSVLQHPAAGCHASAHALQGATSPNNNTPQPAQPAPAPAENNNGAAAPSPLAQA